MKNLRWKKSIQTQPNRFKKPSEDGAYRETQPNRFKKPSEGGAYRETQPNRFKKPSEGGAYRERQNLHEASLLITLTTRDNSKPRNRQKLNSRT